MDDLAEDPFESFLVSRINTVFIIYTVYLEPWVRPLFTSVSPDYRSHENDFWRRIWPLNNLSAFKPWKAEESPIVYSKREAESGGELEQTDFLPIYDDSSMRSIPMDIASDPEAFNIYDYLGRF